MPSLFLRLIILVSILFSFACATNETLEEKRLRRAQALEDISKGSERMGRGFAGASEETTSIAPTKTNREAPFCVVGSFGKQCNFYDVSSCKSSATASGGMCVPNQ